MKKIILIAVAIVILSGTLIWQLMFRTHGYLEERCSANVHYQDSRAPQNVELDGNVTFSLSKNGTGYFNLTGDVNALAQKYTISRYVNFKYIKKEGNAYQVDVVSQHVMAHDDVPKEISGFISKALGMEGKYVLYLMKKKDSYITMGTSLSPVLTCVLQS